LTLHDVADYLRVHPSTVYRLLKMKQLPAFKFADAIGASIGNR
jgi:excisionase family DNA binding protein